MKKITVCVVGMVFASCTYNVEELPLPEETNNNPVVPVTITYTDHAKRLFDTYCIACHAPGATQQFFPLTNFSEVSSYASPGGGIQRRVLDQMSMPPTGSQSGQLSVLERDTLQMWLDQGALQ